MIKSLLFLKLTYNFIESGIILHFITIFFTKNSFKKNKKSQLELAVSCKKFFTKSGPAFIKLGQFLATRPDIIGETIAQELQSLQDHVNPQTLKSSLKNLENIPKFIEKIAIENKPIAAGSIAQVYRGKINANGKIVAVKILRPQIRNKFKQNLDAIAAILSLLQEYIPYPIRLKINDAIKVIEEAMLIETNMQLEAAAAAKLAENARINNLSVHFPKIYWEFSNKDILVMEWIEGFSPSDQEKLLENDINVKDVCDKLATSFFTQAHKDGFFHADIHPGNIIIERKTKKIYLIDCGIISILDNQNRLAIANILHAFIKGDYDKVAKLHKAVGYIPKNKSEALFSLNCRAIATPINNLDSQKISMTELLRNLLSTISDFEMEVQPQLLLLQKSMISLEGTLRIICPQVNMWELAKPWFEQWQKENFSSKKIVKGVFDKAWEKIELLHNYSGAKYFDNSLFNQYNSEEEQKFPHKKINYLKKTKKNNIFNKSKKYSILHKKYRRLKFIFLLLSTIFIIHIIANL